ELKIEGRIRPAWDWIHPAFRAERVTFANAPWGKAPFLLRADSLEITLSVTPLLAGRVSLPDVRLERPEVNLEQDAEGRRNWVLKDEHPNKPSRIRIRNLALDRGQLRYDDAQHNVHVAAELSTDATGVNFEVRGRYRGLAVSGSGHGGPVLALRENQGAPYPLKAAATIGDNSAFVDGKIDELVGLAGLDMNVRLAGKSMDDLYPVIGVALPATPPYSTAGHLVRKGGVIRYENFTGKVGESDLAGTLQVDTNPQRPVMTGDLRSKVLNLADLGPTVGTHKSSGKGVLPDAPFDPKRWKSVDADVKLAAGQIERPEQLPLEDLKTRIRMQDGVLTLDPLEFGTAGGRLAGVIRLDGRQETIRGSARIRVDRLQLAKLFPTVKVTKASVGDLSGGIELAGTGNSVARLLGTSNGQIGLFMEGGQVSEFVMQLAAINLWGIAKAKLGGDRQVPIRCVVGDFGVKDGDMQTNALVFDTQVVNVHGTGDINLKSEELNLTLIPQPKEASLASLRSPLYIRGPFSKPHVGVDVKSIAARGVGAAAMAVINPLLAVIPLIDSGPGKDSNCGKLIAELQEANRAASVGRPKSAPASNRPRTAGAEKPQ
ncbi:MAG: AsmA family protein, partial [Betaproteobacteria bacterium]|nr:AsmA family protein [Betaproteobacteria bacterium]